MLSNLTSNRIGLRCALPVELTAYHSNILTVILSQSLVEKDFHDHILEANRNAYFRILFDVGFVLGKVLFLCTMNNVANVSVKSGWDGFPHNTQAHTHTHSTNEQHLRSSKLQNSRLI